MPAMKTGLLKRQQLGEDTQKEILNVMEKKRTEIDKMEIVLNGL